jgi:hypothetical protein
VDRFTPVNFRPRSEPGKAERLSPKAPSVPLLGPCAATRSTRFHPGLKGLRDNVQVFRPSRRCNWPAYRQSCYLLDPHGPRDNGKRRALVVNRLMEEWSDAPRDHQAPLRCVSA